MIAHLDSGVDYSHPDLAANIWRNEADCDNDGEDDDANGYADDCYGWVSAPSYLSAKVMYMFAELCSRAIPREEPVRSELAP